jgi:hypothetical protein
MRRPAARIEFVAPGQLPAGCAARMIGDEYARHSVGAAIA